MYLNSGQSEKWLELIQQTGNYDFYHLPFYHLLSRSLNEGEPVLFQYQEDSYLICLPLLLRPIDAVQGLEECGRGYKDATSVYGYAGPLCSSRNIPGDVVLRFQESLKAELERLCVVSLFSRLHPIAANISLIQNLGTCRLEGHTVSIDTSLPLDIQYNSFRRNHRKDIERLRSVGMVCREGSSMREIQAFVEIYDESMKRIGATENYFFPEWWYEGFLGSAEATNRLFLCYLDDEPICGGLVAMCNGLVQMHLAATRTEWMARSPLKLLFDHVRLWAAEQHASVLHLGGGVGAKADSLYRFKSGFSKTRHCFHTWRWIIDEPVYDMLARAKGKSIENQELSPGDGFFPRYRA